MPIVTVHRYTRDEIQSHRECLFVFGDNLQRVGTGGQAAACRNEPNAVGITTKRYPLYTEAAYLTDADLKEVAPIIDDEFTRLEVHLRRGGTVIWPEDGVGTGLAKLDTKAPLVRAYIDAKTADLFELAKTLA